MFVTLSDFLVKPMIIPATDDNRTGLESFLSDEEKSLLKKLLGVTFYNLFVEAYNELPEDWSATANYNVDDEVVYGMDIYKSIQAGANKVPPDEPLFWEVQPVNKWLRLITGDVYQVNGFSNYWMGMKELLKPALFSLYLEEYATNQTGMGLTVPNVENADVVSPADKICKFWNTYVDSVFGNIDSDNDKNSLYGYLVYVKAQFDNDVEDAGYSTFQQYLDLNFGDEVERKNVFDF